jgi:predicted DNA-binding transcriptional regulator AlpA
MPEQEHAPLPMPLRAIAQRYDVEEQAVRRWTKDETFPEPVKKGRWDPAEVDAWMRQNNPGAWAFAQSGDNPLELPDLPDKQLLDAVQFGEMLAFLRPNEPEGKRGVPATTIRSYEARGFVPTADRRPDDGKDPEVDKVGWYWSTVRAHIYGSRKLAVTRVKVRARTSAQASERS